MQHPFRTTFTTVAAAVLCSTISTATPSYAAVGDLYAVTGAGNDNLECGGTLSSLYELDPATGAADLIAPVMIGSTQARHITALAMHPSTGVLYAIMNDAEGDDGCDDAVLLTIDAATGEATVVPTSEPLPANIPDMTFDPFGNLYAWTEDTDQLLVIDTSDGTWEFIPDADVNTFATGLASDSDGRLFLKIEDELYRLNQYTGVAFDFVQLDRELHNILAFNAADVMYSGRRTGTGFTLFMINPETGETTTIGSNTVFQISALAFDRGVVDEPVIADLSIEKEVDENQPLIGTDVVFTLTLYNHSNQGAATNIVVSDVLPENFFFVSATGDGNYDDSTGEWTLEFVDLNSTAEIEITATAVADGGWTNSAEVVDSDSYDPDSVPGSGDPSGDTYFEVSGNVVLPTLFSISRHDDTLWVVDPDLSDIDVAQQLSLSGFDICAGHGLATQPTTNTLFGVVSVDDCLTHRLVTIDPVTADATDVGNFGSTWMSAIAFGADQNTLYAASSSDGDSPNTLFTVDPATGALTAECELPATDGERALAFGDDVLFEAMLDCELGCQTVIHVINPAEFPADPTDPCPVDTYETGTSAEPTGLTLRVVGPDYVTLLMASYSAIYEITLPGEFNEADLSLLGFMSHESDGLTFVNTDVTVANLSVSKSAAKTRVKGDKFIEYTLHAQNNGPDDATGVSLTDEIPFGTTLVSLGSGCGEAGGVVTCEAGSLASGATELYSFVVQVTCKKCSSIANTVLIGSDADLYDYPFNNQWQINTSVKGKF